MIYVYPSDCTDFSNNGLGALMPSTCIVTETLNGEWELTLEHTYREKVRTPAEKCTRYFDRCTRTCTKCTPPDAKCTRSDANAPDPTSDIFTLIEMHPNRKTPEET